MINFHYMKATKERVENLNIKAKNHFEKLSKSEIGFDIGQVNDSKVNGESMEIYNGTISVLEKVYGKNSSPLNELLQIASNILSVEFKSVDGGNALLLKSIIGILSSLNLEIENRLSLEKRASKEMLINFFISYSKDQFIKGNLDISSVLGFAALEDSLKLIAEINGLDVAKKSMVQVVNAINSKGLIDKCTFTLLGNYAQMRNSVFHANWESFDKSEIENLIRFTSQFLKDIF